MRRRDFIAGVGGATLALPRAWLPAALAQQSPMRRIGVLMPNSENDRIEQLQIVAFRQSLAKVGWTEDRNVRIDLRWGADDIDHMRASAAELIGLRPDVLVAAGTPALTALRQVTSATPIVFTVVADPIGRGFVASLARPGGNITGFILHEPPLAGKWVQLLMATVPALRKIAFIFNPDLTSVGEFFRYAETAAAPLKVEMTATPVHDDQEIEDVFAALARDQNGGLITNADAFILAHREQIITLSKRYRVPAMYPFGYLSREGGLVSYGVDLIDPFRQAAGYVDRILRGEKRIDLPVQAPTKYELVINLKTARAIELDVSADMLSIANEVIE